MILFQRILRYVAVSALLTLAQRCGGSVRLMKYAFGVGCFAVAKTSAMPVAGSM